MEIIESTFQGVSQASDESAVYASHSKVHINNSHFLNNTFKNSSIFVTNHSLLTIVDSSFQNNIGLGFPGSVIRAENNVTMYISDTTFTQNSGNVGSCLFVATAELTIQAANFTENTAKETGGVMVISGDVNVTLKDSNFEHNSADQTNEGAGGVGVIGFGSQLIVQNSNFSFNYAAAGGVFAIVNNGGAVFSNATFMQNNATLAGGAIGVHNRSHINMSRCAFLGNVAQLGGAIVLDSNSTAVSSRESLFNLNVAYFGGAICGMYGSMIYAGNTQFTSNKAAGSLHDPMVRGRILRDFVDTGGGVISVLNNSSLKVNKCNFSQNTAFWGGVLFVAFQSRATVDKSMFANNTVTGSGEIQFLPSGGAALITKKSSLIVRLSSFQDNVAQAAGGAVVVANGSNLFVHNCTFMRNSGVLGGAVHLIQSKCAIETSLFKRNVAGQNALGRKEAFGGAVRLLDSSCTVNQTLFVHNTATEGGGVSSEKISFELLAVLVSVQQRKRWQWTPSKSDRGFRVVV